MGTIILAKKSSNYDNKEFPINDAQSADVEENPKIVNFVKVLDDNNKNIDYDDVD